jgi:hypothetical protein
MKGRRAGVPSYLKDYKSPPYKKVPPRRETIGEEIDRRTMQMPDPKTVWWFNHNLPRRDKQFQFTPHEGPPRKLF